MKQGSCQEKNRFPPHKRNLLYLFIIFSSFASLSES